MGLYMRANGVYYIKFEQKGNVNRFSTKTRDPEMAKELYEVFLKGLLENRIAGTLARSNTGVAFTAANQPPTSSIEIDPVFGEYLETDKVKEVSYNTQAFKTRLRDQLKQFGFIFFKDFTQSKLNAWFTSLREKYDANDTIMKYIQKIKAFLHYAIKKGYYEEKDFNRLDWLSLPGKVRETTIPAADYARILDHLKEKGDVDFAMYLETLYNTCSRPAEIVPLSVADFDFNNNCVTIIQNKLRHKSGNPNKWSYFSDDFKAVLLQYIQKNAITEKVFRGAASSNPIFYSKKWQSLKVELNLPAEYTLYSVRHTAITDTLDATGDLEFASKQAGHASVEMTAKHYVNRKPGKYKDLANKRKTPACPGENIGGDCV